MGNFDSSRDWSPRQTDTEAVLWTWLPFGWTGVRTTLLLSCGILVIVLRIAQYHVGLRTSSSAFHTFLRHALKLQTAEAIFTYVVSATLFSQVYLSSLPNAAGLDWLVYFTEARARLNERPLFFTSYFISLGLVQAALHVYNDTDRLSLGVVRPQDARGTAPSKEPVNQVRHFFDQVPLMVVTAVNRSFTAVGVNFIVYFFFLRTVLWRSAMTFLRPFVTLPKTNMLPTAIPFTLWTLIRCFWAGFLLLLLWNAGNVAFSIFLVREPLKNNKPLTSDSKDPNGSLLNGLKNKKIAIKVPAPPLLAQPSCPASNPSSALPCGSWLSLLGTTKIGARRSTKTLNAKMGPCGIRLRPFAEMSSTAWPCG